MASPAARSWAFCAGSVAAANLSLIRQPGESGRGGEKKCQPGKNQQAGKPGIEIIRFFEDAVEAEKEQVIHWHDQNG